MIYHFWSQFEPKDPATKGRQRVAQTTWSTQLWTEFPIPDALLPRMWEEEGRHYPYVIDLFDHACWAEVAPLDSILVYTNSDVCVRSDCALRVAGAMQDTDAFYSMRRDFNHDFHEPIPDDVIPRGDAYVGSDFYAFRARWWRENRKDFPDMLIACELWDAVLRTLIERTNSGKPISVPDLSYHRRHSSWWEQTENRYRLKGQLHNLKLGSQWLKTRGINPRAHGVPDSLFK